MKPVTPNNGREFYHKLPYENHAIVSKLHIFISNIIDSINLREKFNIHWQNQFPEHICAIYKKEFKECKEDRYTCCYNLQSEWERRDVKRKSKNWWWEMQHPSWLFFLS